MTLATKQKRCWLQGEDEIFTSAGTCSMAFRILRGYGYNISSGTSLVCNHISLFSYNVFCCSNSFDEFVYLIDPIAQFLEQEQCSGHLNDIYTMLDLYQALEMIIATDQPVSKKLNSSTLESLIQRLSGEFYPPNGLTKQIHEQVLAISCIVFSSYYCYSLFDLGPTATVAYF